MSLDILLFISDQHAPQYQAGGQMPVDTPNLAALREQGTTFDAAYTPCPLCVPARMAMLSGLAPHHTGIFTNNDTLPQTTPTFLHAMAAAGYETVLVGRMHFIGPDQRHGFTRRVAPDFTNSGWARPQKTLEQDFGVHTQTMGYKWCIDVVGGGTSPVVCYDDMVLDALEQYLAQPHSKPQLIVVGTYGPHFPYVAPPELFLKYLKTAQLPAAWQGNEPWLNAQQRNLQEPNTRAEIVLACQAAYKGLVEHTDGLIGRARAAFDAFTQSRGTPALFGYLSDHGDTVGEHGIYGKKSFFEKSVRIPMVFAGSGVAAGQRVTAPVSLLDLGPTVCDWAGADPLPETDGQSLAAVLRGEPADADRTVWSEIVDKLPQGGWTYSCMARHGQQKFITCHRDEIHDQLFDVIADPDETTNLADAQPDETAAFAAAAARRVDFAAAEALQKRHAAAAAVLAKAEIATSGDDRERYRDYPSAAKEAPQYCVTNLTSAPGKSQTHEFYGLPDVNN